jgi:hypothetical protein
MMGHCRSHHMSIMETFKNVFNTDFVFNGGTSKKLSFLPMISGTSHYFQNGWLKEYQKENFACNELNARKVK